MAVSFGGTPRRTHDELRLQATCGTEGPFGYLNGRDGVPKWDNAVG